MVDLLGTGTISVVMPVYNAEPFLERAVDSVLGQSYERFELILVDDGSSDESFVLCDDLSRKDLRIRVFSQVNSGPAAARNRGVQEATGDWVYFLDADDYLLPETFEVMLRAYRDEPADMVLSNFAKLETDGTLVPQQVTFAADQLPFTGSQRRLDKAEIPGFVVHFLQFPSNHLVSYCWARLYRLELIRELQLSADPSMRLFEDYVFNLAYLRHCRKLLFVNQRLYVYVMHNSHQSASMTLFQTDSLIHDMAIFRAESCRYLQVCGGSQMTAALAEQAAGHTLIHYLIIFLVRASRLAEGDFRQRVEAEMARIVSAPLIRECLRHYRPQKGNTRLLPMLIRLRMVKFIVALCRYKANRRYGRPQ